MIRLFWWNKEVNVGDMLSPYVVKRAFGEPCVWTEAANADLAAIGSILHMLPETFHGGIWGSGVFDTHPVQVSLEKATLLRGLLTCSAVGKTTAICDPGILISRYFPVEKTRKFKLGIIPHHGEREDLKKYSICHDPDVLLISPCKEVEPFCKQVAMCEAILSSSLHGLIIADSYGIRNAWTCFNETGHIGKRKFHDYFSAFDREAYEIYPKFDDTLETILPRITYTMDEEVLRSLQTICLNHRPTL